MEILKHRVNKILDIVPRIGLEIDIRDFNNELVLSHDHPTQDSIKLTDFFQQINSDVLIAINIKTSEIEKELYEIISNSRIHHYFTFDWPIPSLQKALQSNLICAFRLSEYEKYIHPNCSWVWLDSFHSIWYDLTLLRSLKGWGLKIAVVSPELHQRESELENMKEIVKSGMVDAICTDLPEYWL